jgi:hypothetical protein
MQSIDAWIARQEAKPDRSEAIRRLVEISEGEADDRLYGPCCWL